MLSLASIVGETSPANAPLSSQWQCWAPGMMSILSVSMAVWTVRRSVRGGGTDTSTAAWSSLRRRYDSFCTVCRASKWLWCIFQLPLMSGLRSGVGIGGSPQSGDPGQVTLLEQFQRASPAGGHVVDAIGELELRDGRRA